jgi:hypothetical protein
MLASTTSTIIPDRGDCGLEWHLASGAAAGAVEDLVEGWLGGVLDQARPQIFLQRLVRSRSPLAEHGVGLVGNVLDLNTRHGAIMALQAPLYKLVHVDETPNSAHAPDVASIASRSRTA